MRTKHFILILCCVVITTIIFIVLGPAGEPNDSLKSIVTQTHQQFNKFQENLRVVEEKKLEIDPKYLEILGFTSNSLPTKSSQYYQYNSIGAGGGGNQLGNNEYKNPSLSSAQVSAGHQTNDGLQIVDVHHLPLQQVPPVHISSSSAWSPSSISSPSQYEKYQLIDAKGHPARVTTAPFNGTKANFTIVTYVQDGQAPSAILLSQNIAAKFPNEFLLIYDLGLSEEDAKALSAYCNNSKCAVITYDLSVFPSYVADQRMRAYRPIVIKDALMRSKCILFAENYMRIRGSSRELAELQSKVMVSGVLGWSTTPTAVSTRTHPKMYNYFQTVADHFYFLRMVDLDTALFTDSLFVTEKIMLPWIKCALTLECIDPIGAQSNGCKYNKKPQYRYSGCHAYDTSAFNIVLGLTWHFDDSKYSLPSETYQNMFHKETLEQATKILENQRRNSSETSEHPFTDD